MRLTDLNGIVMSNKITLGEMISLSILMVTLAGGGYTLHSDIIQTRLEVAEVRLELGQTRLELSEKIDAKFNQVDAKVDEKANEVNRRIAGLQERVAMLETLVRGQAPGAAASN